MASRPAYVQMQGAHLPVQEGQLRLQHAPHGLQLRLARRRDRLGHYRRRHHGSPAAAAAAAARVEAHEDGVDGRQVSDELRVVGDQVRSIPSMLF